jgi:TolB-like protein/Tfp pilus assembly protein PilF
MDKATNLFCSYSRRDSDFAERIVNFVSSRGYSVWMDQSGIDGASIWTESIVEAIDESGAVILLVSSHSVNSPHVLKEISLAMEKNKVVFPLIIEKTDLPRTFQYLLAGIQQIEMNEASFALDKVKEKLIKSFKSHLAVAPSDLGEGKKDSLPEPKEEAPLGNSIAVLPLRSISPNKDYDFIADGLSDSIITNLGKVEGIKVLSRQTISGFKGETDSVLSISDKFGVKFILEGSVLCSGQQILVNASLFNSEEKDIVWSESYERNVDKVISLIRELALGIATEIKDKLTADDRQRLESGVEIKANIYKLITIGRQKRLLKDRDGLGEAIDTLRQAFEMDPDNAVVMSELLFSHILGIGFGHFGSTPELSDEINRLSEDLSNDISCPAEGLMARSLKAELIDSDIASAEKLLREAEKLNPSNSEIAQELAFFLGRKGDFEEAFTIMQSALSLEEEELHAMNALGYLSFYRGNYFDAVKYMNKVLEINVEFYPALIILALSYGELMEFEKSKSALDRIGHNNPTVKSQVGYLFAKQKKSKEAENQIQMLDQDFSMHPFRDYAKSVIYLALGEIDKSTEILQAAVSKNGFVARDLTLGNDPRISLLIHHPDANQLKGLVMPR